MPIKKKIKRGAKALKRGFKTLAVKRKGKVASKLAKELKRTRPSRKSVPRFLKRKRALTKRRAKRLLN